MSGAEGTHPQHLLDRLHAAPEKVHVEFLKARTRDGQIEVDALVQRVNLDAGLQRERKFSQTAGTVACIAA